MSNNQRSSSFLAIRFLLTALIAVVFITGSTIGTGASIAPLGDKKGDRESTKGVKSEAPTAAFTAGNLAVVQIGDGTTLSGNATSVSVVEYTPAGALVQTIALPSVTSPRLTMTGTSTSEGHLVRSVDGNYLTLTGYDVANGTAAGTFAVAGTPRTIARINAAGTVDLTTAFNDGSTGAVRNAVTTNGTDMWMTNAANGVRYGTFGAVGTSTQMSATPTNTRVTKIFNGQLYVTSGSANFTCVNTIGTGTPTASGNTTTPLPGMVCTARSPYSFSISPSGTTMYLADDGAFGSNGGIQKWTLAAGTWTNVYTLLNSGTATTSVRGLTVNWNGVNPIIYATTSTATPNSLIAVVDTGAAATATTLATSAAGTLFRGVDFVPGAVTAAGVFVSGRVTTADGRGITNAAVTITGNALAEPRTVITGRRGTYMFEDLEPGATYIVTVRSRRFMFSNPSQVINIVDNVSNADFVDDSGTNRGQ